MYVGYQQVVADDTVKTQNNLTIPATATGAELQAETSNIRYTMDGATSPAASPASTGMLLITGLTPKQFTIADIRNIKFCRDTAQGKLNVHYFK